MGQERQKIYARKLSMPTTMHWRFILITRKKTGMTYSVALLPYNIISYKIKALG